MFKNRSTIIVFLLTILSGMLDTSMIPKELTENNANCPKRCLYAFRCSPYYSQELVWALHDGICKVFANGCIYGSIKCQRENDCLPAMIDSNKTECQNRCANGCNAKPEATVCGLFPSISTFGTPGEEFKEFRNQCELDQWSCSNERPYAFVNQGPCT